jgi:hypothetical protein
VVDAPQQGAPAESAPRAPNPAGPEAQCGPCVVVCGEPVTEFRALIDDQAGVLVTQDQTVVFNRLYLVDGKWNLGNGPGTKIAGEAVLAVTYDPATYLRIETTNYVAVVPAHSIKASWRKA